MKKTLFLMVLVICCTGAAFAQFNKGGPKTSLPQTAYEVCMTVDYLGPGFAGLQFEISNGCAGFGNVNLSYSAWIDHELTAQGVLPPVSVYTLVVPFGSTAPGPASKVRLVLYGKIVVLTLQLDEKVWELEEFDVSDYPGGPGGPGEPGGPIKPN